jgi:hypothetical protein
VSAWKRRSREKRHDYTEIHKENWNFNRAELPLHVSVCCTVYEQSKMRQKSFRFIKFSSSWDNAWFHTSAVVVLHVSVCCQDYLASGGFQQFSYNRNNIGRLTWCCEDCQKNRANYQDGKDWRLYRGFQNCEGSWIRRWLWRWKTIVMWFSQVSL